MQNVVDTIRGKRDDPKAIAESLSKLGRDRETQAALDNAAMICANRVRDGGLSPDKFYTCQADEFIKQLQRPSRIGTDFTVKPEA
jgi:hypothetical protein